MKSLPFFCWYPVDAETDENFRAMTYAEVGFYLRCLKSCRGSTTGFQRMPVSARGS